MSLACQYGFARLDDRTYRSLHHCVKAIRGVMNALSVKELAIIVGGRLRLGKLPPLGGEYEPISRVATNGRKIRAGEVYWGINEAGFHGADFAEMAYSRGASGVVVSGRRVEPWAGRFSIQVDDANAAIRTLGRWARQRFLGKLVAVVGSWGGSNYRRAIDSVLCQCSTGKVWELESVSPEVGCRQLLELSPRDDYAVLEFPMASVQEVRALLADCSPHLVVIAGGNRFAELCPGEVQFEASLVQDVNPRPTVIVTCSPDSRDPSEYCLPCCRVSEPNGARFAYSLKNPQSGDNGLLVEMEGTRFRMADSQKNNLEPVLVAYTVARMLGHSQQSIAASFDQPPCAPLRYTTHRGRGVRLLYVTQEMTLQSVRNSIDLLRDIEIPGRRIVVCGELPFQFSGRDIWHRHAGEEIVSGCEVDHLIACGQSSREVVMGARGAGMSLRRSVTCRDPGEALTMLDTFLEVGDALLILDSEQGQLQRLLEKLAEQPLAMSF